MSSPEPSKTPMKYILVTGGVISGVGKTTISSSLGVLLKNSGYKVSAIKIDPYLNIDAPSKDGGIFLLDDGGTVDMDLGSYECFLNGKLRTDNHITTGKMFQHVVEKERRGDFIGKTVQMIPHLTQVIVDWVERVARIPVDGSHECPDVCIVELGGTIGDIEAMAYLAAFERFSHPALKETLMNVHVSLVIHPKATGEPKTKPMQNSVRHLRASGLVPDLLICRSSKKLQDHLRKKIADFGLVDVEQVIRVHDVSNIYKVPLLLQEQGVLDAVIKRLHLPPVKPNILRDMKFTMVQWTHLSELVDSFNEVVTIAVVSKYTKFEAASVNKALTHAAINSRKQLEIKLVDSELLEAPKPGQEEKNEEAWKAVKEADGIVVPGGFDFRGVEGMIACCKYAREKKIPFLGICLGMQCASIEYARNILGIEGAHSTEFKKDLAEHQQIVIDMPEHDVEKKGLGGTMRLGRRTTVFLTENCKLRKLYRKDEVEERHRHRYEVNPLIVPELSKKGLLFVGMGVDEQNTHSFLQKCGSQISTSLKQMAESKENEDLLSKISDLCLRGKDGSTREAVRLEMIELVDHPYYVGGQFHPEYLSNPLNPSPMFLGLLLAATGQLDAFLSGKNVPTPTMTLEKETIPEMTHL